jgi:hypothetical protein
MSAPPPNFDPNASILEGGTAPIVAVMGGGGIPPDGYNENESLLQVPAGAIPSIVAMAGGAETPKTILEIYTIPIKEKQDFKDILSALFKTFGDNVPQFWDTNIWKKEMSNLFKEYTASRNRLWENIKKRMNFTKKFYLPILSTIDNEPLDTFVKVIHFLPETVKYILIAPPIKGDPDKLMSYIIYLLKNDIMIKKGADYKIKDEYVIVFQHTFYGDLAPENFDYSKIGSLIYLFLKLAAKNPNNIFILARYDKTNIVTGQTIYNKFGFLNSEENQTLLNFYEPTYLIYPYKISVKYSSGILISANSEIPLNEIENQQLTQYIKTNSESGGLILFNNTTDDKEKLDGFFHLIRRKGTEIPDNNVCDNSGTDIDTLTTPSMFATQDLKTLIIRINAVNLNPLFCNSEEMVKASTGEFRETINGVDVILRKPTAYNITKWREGDFTDSEKNFLTSLHLTTNILKAIFEDSWGDEIVKFFTSLIYSKCYSDVSLLTRRECNNTRTFLNKVKTYFIEKGVSEKEAPEFVDTKEQGFSIDDIPTDDFSRKWAKARENDLKIEVDKSNYSYINLALIDPIQKKYLFKKLTYFIGDKTENDIKEIFRNEIKKLEKNFPNFIILY